MSTATALAPTVHRISSTIPITAVPQIARGAVAPIKTNCSNCHLREICLPCGMSNSDVERLEKQ